MTISAAFWWEEDEENSEARVNAEAIEVLQNDVSFFLSFFFCCDYHHCNVRCAPPNRAQAQNGAEI